MRIIDGNDMLRACIPNTFTTAPGEPSWYDKLYPYLEEAEQWLADNITGDAVLDAIDETPEATQNKPLCARIVTAHALLNAIPSLDLVLTPNGFGIVNTSNVVPASRDRIERLINSVEAQRDYAIDSLLFKLPHVNGWLDTQQGRYFAATLFPRISICRRLNIREHVYDKYLELHERFVKIENVLAETYFSQEQYEVFRDMVAKQVATHPMMTHVISRLQSLETMLATDLEVHVQSFYDLVNTIREHEEIFPEWHSSRTAQLYSPTVFLNKKESTGYWF